ncbi:MAG: glutamine--fructose-6-phosphate transaminase (isomerizing) [Rhodanobacteraceae bacterium]
MCGIVAATAQRDVLPILIAGLKALEYRGYDSAGIAALTDQGIHRIRAKGKVRELENRLQAAPFSSHTGIAHTRWATHGEPSESNAHPHLSGPIAVVHNGIIENHEALRSELAGNGCQFSSETDTEVIAHLINQFVEAGASLQQAVQQATGRLKGAYAIAVLSQTEPGIIVGARRGSPLVVGIGIGEHFLGSDVHALIQVTRKVIYLEEGDLVQISREQVQILDHNGTRVERASRESTLSGDTIDRGPFRHFMLKEIFEQPSVVADTLEARLGEHGVLPNIFGIDSDALLAKTRAVHIVACGTSYHAGLIARYWLEGLAGIPVSVEVASEFRYRKAVVPEGALLVTISQSGETADTLAALREAKQRGYLGSLALCNVPESSLVRETDLTLMTRAGPEIGVASTKAFVSQLTALALFTLELGQRNGLAAEKLDHLCAELASLPRLIEQALELDSQIARMAERFVPRQHALFLGRGVQYPVALEGALKLKEISYIHAEAYPAGELKHGPLALVDQDMPVIAVAPNNQLLEKLKSNLQEVSARGGELYVFADADADISAERSYLIKVHSGGNFIAPAVFTVPLQLLAYHVAVLRGTDVDQPRNLAKSVTVE